MRRILAIILLFANCVICQGVSTPGMTEIKIPLSDYVQIASEGRLPGDQMSIGIPVLEIFNAKGVPIYYANSSLTIVPDLQTLHKRLASLKPIANHAPLETFFKSLKDTGNTIQDPSAHTHAYIFVFVRSDRQKSEPEIRAEKALLEFVRSEPENLVHVFKLVVSGIPPE